MDATKQIDEVIAGLGDWRGATLAGLRKAIHAADPQIVEEVKWRGAPAFSDSGIVCVAGAFKDKVKLTFYNGASLPDPGKVFNSELEGKQWRAIDLREGDKVDERAFKALVRAAVELNRSKSKPAPKRKAKQPVD